MIVGGARIELVHVTGRHRRVLCECRPDPARAEELTAHLAAGLGGVTADEVVLRLPREQVLEPEVEVPAVAATALGEVLAQEMDRKTPFSAGDVHFDYRVTGSDPVEDRLHVRMRVARRSDIAAAVRLARAIGLSPTRVDGEERNGEMYNLLPEAERSRPSRLMPRLIGAAVVITAALAAAAIYVIFDHAEKELALIEAELARQRTRAAEVRTLQDQVDALKASAMTVIEERRSRMTAAELVNEVTQRIPSQHWLFEMRSRGGKLYLFGYSPAAAELLRSLEASPVLSGGSFAAPLVAGPEEGLERFTIVLDIGTRPAEESKP
jgi:general secretion pathway protein L